LIASSFAQFSILPYPETQDQTPARQIENQDHGNYDSQDAGRGLGDQRRGNRGQGNQGPSLAGSHTPHQGYNSFDYRNPYNNRGQNQERGLSNGRGGGYGQQPNNGRPVIQPPRLIQDPQPPRLISDPPRPIIQPPRFINDPPRPINSHGPAPVQGRRPGYNRGNGGGGYMIYSNY